MLEWLKYQSIIKKFLSRLVCNLIINSTLQHRRPTFRFFEKLSRRLLQLFCIPAYPAILCKILKNPFVKYSKNKGQRAFLIRVSDQTDRISSKNVQLLFFAD